ncbi:hydantoinase/oxoprolinase family protein [Ancylobacter mangrovi]|uniref:hydantoinase/oxoprolinase family protein n=1 Tax=Ancylobacter mangrovi TaxID=2972472 RepID=UPI002162763F|nr:hydantoinase/oxoprolinase family protein [Ancylobacter mangrovi]MCS0502014.1 hydantoinase/oxoprolinase family protein [Ancylobacter mangrovi]
MSTALSWSVGVDVGGTFTDLVAREENSGRFVRHKRPSTPHDPAEAILSGLSELCALADIDPRTIASLSHGTTVATNALIEKRGGTVALIVTEGFRDLLEIGRQTRPKIYDFQTDHPEPLVPRHLRFEARERITVGGRIITPLDDGEIARLVAAVQAAGADSCAICLLFSFAEPDHERRIADALRAAMPDLHLSLSSEVQPEFREYERLSTTVLNAYLQPVMTSYLARLEREAERLSPGVRLGINQSSGGLISGGRARMFPIRTALSGPAAGVAGTIDIASHLARRDLITLDIGGTSSDIALIRGARAAMIHERWIEGYPARLASVDINAVGAGGGSIAWIDADGLLKVGPRSAGAYPGPACYGRGGDQPTVSDANMVLGRLSDRGLLGGAMPLDRAAAERVVGRLADELGLPIERTALGIIDVAVANMARGIRSVSIERGHNPAEFSLFAFGGAGPLHASAVARQLGISHIVVPPEPGLLCAQGLIVADRREDFVRTAPVALARGDLARLGQAAAELRELARDWFAAEQVAPEDQATEMRLDMRYVGQNFELGVAVADDPATVGRDELAERFHEAHALAYGFMNPQAPVEVVSVRLAAVGRRPRSRIARAREQGRDREPARLRPVWYAADAPAEALLHDRAHLVPGDVVAGPAIIEQLDTTTVLFPGDQALVDDGFNLLITVQA